MEIASETTEFGNAAMRRSKAWRCLICAVLLVLLLRQMSVHATSIVYLYMSIVGAGVVVLLGGMVRSLRMGISLTPDRVVVRTTFSTKSWKWDELERVESIDVTSRGGPMGIGTYTTQRTEPRTLITPVFRPVRGAPVVVRGLRVATSSPNDANWLDDALHEVNRAIAEHRTAPGTGGATATPS